jgi:hypothetical protein
MARSLIAVPRREQLLGQEHRLAHGISGLDHRE